MSQNTQVISTRLGFDAMGHPIPLERSSAALQQVREMVPDIGTEEAFTLIGRVSKELERDEPFEAIRVAREVLDLTGAYRLIAVLLTAPLEVNG